MSVLISGTKSRQN